MILNLNTDKHLLKDLYTQFTFEKPKYQKAFDYYVGLTDIMKTYPITDRSNQKVNVNFVKTFIEEEVAYSVGNKVTYINKGLGSDVVNNIESVIEDNTLDTRLNTTLLTYGLAYELHYINKGEFKARICTPLNSIAYKNIEGDAEVFIYFYKKQLDDKIYCDVFDDKCIYTFDDTFNTLLGIKEHYFGTCPVSIAELENGIEDTIYYTIKNLQDSYETIISNWSNEITDTRLAYLVVTGGRIEAEDAKEMKSMGILQTPDNGSRIEYLIKNIPSDFIKQYESVVKENIYKVANHIDNQTQVQSNTSGTMLQTRLNCLRIKIMKQQKCLKNALNKRVQDIFTYLNVTSNRAYSYKDIDIQFTLNLPSNDVEMAQIITQLNGKLSTKTALSQLSFITNAEEEYKRVLEENKELQMNVMGMDSNGY